jgi:PAS domain S-box-containing protein
MVPPRDDHRSAHDSADLPGAFPDRVGGARAKAGSVVAIADQPGTDGRLPSDLFARLVGGIRDYAIFALDPTGRVRTWNEGAKRIKGYSADEIIGKHFSVFYPPERVASGFPEFELRTASATGRFEDEGWRVRKDGSRFWANVVITALRRRRAHRLRESHSRSHRAPRGR